MTSRLKAAVSVTKAARADRDTAENRLVLCTETKPDLLIGHLLERYHTVHREQLPKLIDMARRVEALHQTHPLVPVGLCDLLQSMQSELLAHMQKEEVILFPLFKAGGHPCIGQPISMMRCEHEEHQDSLLQLAQITHQAIPPDDACNTWRALYEGVAQFHDDLMDHIDLENNLLFAQFEARQAAPI